MKQNPETMKQIPVSFHTPPYKGVKQLVKQDVKRLKGRSRG